MQDSWGSRLSSLIASVELHREAFIAASPPPRPPQDVPASPISSQSAASAHLNDKHAPVVGSVPTCRDVTGSPSVAAGRETQESSEMVRNSLSADALVLLRQVQDLLTPKIAAEAIETFFVRNSINDKEDLAAMLDEASLMECGIPRAPSRVAIQRVFQKLLTPAAGLASASEMLAVAGKSASVPMNPGETAPTSNDGIGHLNDQISEQKQQINELELLVAELAQQILQNDAAQSDVGEPSPQSDIGSTTQSDIGETSPQSDNFSSFYPWSSKR